MQHTRGTTPPTTAQNQQLTMLVSNLWALLNDTTNAKDSSKSQIGNVQGFAVAQAINNLATWLGLNPNMQLSAQTQSLIDSTTPGIVSALTSSIITAAQAAASQGSDANVSAFNDLFFSTQTINPAHTVSNAVDGFYGGSNCLPLPPNAVAIGSSNPINLGNFQMYAYALMQNIYAYYENNGVGCTQILKNICYDVTNLNSDFSGLGQAPYTELDPNELAILNVINAPQFPQQGSTGPSLVAIAAGNPPNLQDLADYLGTGSNSNSAYLNSLLTGINASNPGELAPVGALPPTTQAGPARIFSNSSGGLSLSERNTLTHDVQNLSNALICYKMNPADQNGDIQPQIIAQDIAQLYNDLNPLMGDNPTTWTTNLMNAITPMMAAAQAAASSSATPSEISQFTSAFFNGTVSGNVGTALLQFYDPPGDASNADCQYLPANTLPSGASCLTSTQESAFQAAASAFMEDISAANALIASHGSLSGSGLMGQIQQLVGDLFNLLNEIPGGASPSTLDPAQYSMWQALNTVSPNLTPPASLVGLDGQLESAYISYLQKNSIFLNNLLQGINVNPNQITPEPPT